MIDITPRDVILVCRKYRKVLLLLLGFCTIAGIYYVATAPARSVATVVFFINNSLEPTMVFSDNIPPAKLGSEDDNGRIIQFGFSTEMVDFLIGKFQLYRYYNIDSAKEGSYQTVSQMIYASIRLVEFENHTLKLYVENTDKYLAAAMANAFVVKLDEMNKKFLFQNGKKSLEVYESYHGKLSDKISQLEGKMLSDEKQFRKMEMQGKGFLSDYKQTKYAMEYTKAKIDFLQKEKNTPDSLLVNLQAEYEGLAKKFTLLASDSEKYVAGISSFVDLEKSSMQISQVTTFFYNELNNTEKLRQRMVEALNIQSKLSSLIILKKAFPEDAVFNTSKIWFSAIVAFLTIWSFIAGLVVWEKNRDYIKFIFSPVSGK